MQDWTLPLLWTTWNMIFSVTFYSELHSAISFTIDVVFYQVKLLMYYNDQTTNLTLVDIKWDIQCIVIALCKPKQQVTLNITYSVVIDPIVSMLLDPHLTMYDSNRGA